MPSFFEIKKKTYKTYIHPKGFRNYFSLFFVLFVILATSITLSLSVKAGATDLESRVIGKQLSNGMTILIMERHQAPVCSLYIRYKVGKVDEPKGRTGTAHLLEHLMFKGTKTIGTRDYEKESVILEKIKKVGQALDKELLKGREGDPNRIDKLSAELDLLQHEHKAYVVKDEMDLLYSQNGAVGFNAFTSSDMTTYTVSLPSNRIELWARLESDRMLNPVLREFYSERNVVMEERRQSYDSQPFRKLLEQFQAAAFIAHPYRNPIIGWESDIRFLDPDSTMAFFRSYYAPNNVVVAAVGDIEPENFMALMETYFGRIPSQPPVPPVLTKEPVQKGEHRVEVIFDSEPQLIIGYLKPTLPDRVDYAFDIISSVLTDGRTSRLYKRMVSEDKVAVRVSSSNGLPGARFPNIFTIFATPRYPNTTEEIEKIIYEELDRLKEEPVSDWELGKIKNQIQTDLIRELKSNSGMANKLSYFETVAGDWRYISTYLDVITTITTQEIQDVAREYLKPDTRTVATLVKESEGENGL
ncbi:MAG: M16 family metallopeptidase [bacterium]